MIAGKTASQINNGEMGEDRDTKGREMRTGATKDASEQNMRETQAQAVRWGAAAFFDVSREEIAEAIVDAQGPLQNFIAVNAHTLFLAERDAEFAEILRGSYGFCDGFGVHLLCVLQGKARPRNRTTPTDFMWLVFERLAAAGKRMYCVGDRREVVAAFSEMVNARHPGLVCGWRDGFFQPGSGEEAAILDDIQVCKPHLLCVGMGQPRQEKWARHHQSVLPCAAAFHIGASMAFATGHRRRGPQWATDHGLEWLFRVLSEPRKMFSRYFVEIPWLIGRAVRRRWSKS